MSAYNPQSAIETATADVVHDLNSAITHEWKSHNTHCSENEFRRILAGYFEHQTLRDWCHIFGIEAPEGTPPDHPESAGERRSR